MKKAIALVAATLVLLTAQIWTQPVASIIAGQGEIDLIAGQGEIDLVAGHGEIDLINGSPELPGELGGGFGA